jgi:transcriptional regulator with XRE-family HTH domain
LIDARVQLNITQEELAQRVGTQKSNISRFESGSYNPTLDFVTKIAQSLGKEIHISLS